MDFLAAPIRDRDPTVRQQWSLNRLAPGIRPIGWGRSGVAWIERRCNVCGPLLGSAGSQGVPRSHRFAARASRPICGSRSFLRGCEAGLVAVGENFIRINTAPELAATPRNSEEACLDSNGEQRNREIGAERSKIAIPYLAEVSGDLAIHIRLRDAEPRMRFGELRVEVLVTVFDLREPFIVRSQGPPELLALFGQR